ncbi:MAG: UDP-N-acetylglucosamine--N-acetylmuramyl-(pentapeptide) pyrophosphoryl-undecaprenol N-acetylglucosamine transferase [Hydrogenobaculum sp.]
MEKTFLVSGGGTGGHFFPAVSFLELLREKNLKSIYVGSYYGIEKRLQEDIPSQKIFLDTKGFVGKGYFDKLRSLYLMGKSVYELNKAIRDDFIGVAFGGYASLPVGILSALKRKHLFIHEQNAIPSLTNRLLSKKSTLSFTTFYYTSKFFKNPLRVGMPLREEFLSFYDKKELQKEFGLESPCILVMGGSQGAKALNDTAVEFFQKTNFNGVIIAGDKHFDEVYNALKSLKRVKVFPFFKEIYKLMKACDVAVSRSGASTVYEMASVGLPAVFVPYPYAFHNHQYYNALEIKDLGGAKVLEQKDLNLQNLIEAIEDILKNLEIYSKNISSFCIKNEKNGIILPQEIMLEKIMSVL